MEKERLEGKQKGEFEIFFPLKIMLQTHFEF